MATNPHIYVSSNHGTNTGASDTSYASRQTGAITSLTAGNVYDNLGSAITGAAPTSGDIIYIDRQHVAAYDNLAAVVIPAGVTVISVDENNIDQYYDGAEDALTDGTDDYIIGAGAPVGIHGVNLSTLDDAIVCNADNGTLILQDCSLTGSGTNDIGLNVSTGATGWYIKLLNVDNDGPAGGYGLNVSDCVIEWNAGNIPSITQLFNAFRDATVRMNGITMSSVTTLFSARDIGAGNVYLELRNCTLSSSLTLPTSASFGKLGQRFEMYNCDDTAGVYHRFYIADWCGTAQNNDSTYVTATESWYEGTDKSSIEVTTSANCSHNAPFIFELPAQYIDLSQTASDVVTLDLVTDSTALSLTDVDIAAYLVYPDGTTSVQPNWITTGKTATLLTLGNDPLDAGTALSTSAKGASDWTGEPGSANFYKLELDTSGDAGQATIASVVIEVYKPSIASGDLFIHPIIGTS